MVTQCPKCQTTLTLEFQDLEMGSKIRCTHCDAHLKIKVIPELIVDPSQALTSNGDALHGEYPSPEDSKRSVLICIDGEATREIMKSILETLHYTVLDIPSGRPDLKQMQGNPPALAFIDAGLSDMTGTELCRQIKGSPDLRKTIVILVGSMFEKNAKYRREAPDLAGADDYIDRHEIQKGLLNKIEQHLAKVEKTESEKFEPLSTRDSFETLAEAAAASEIHPEPTSEETEQAMHFAETIVSDIVRFNDRKVEEGLRDGDFYEILSDEIREGQDVYQRKVSQNFWNLDYYEQALENFVRENEQKQIQEASGTDIPPSERPTQVFEKEQILNENATPETAGELDESSYLVKGARRLSKIIVSDIVIYNESKVEEGLKKGNFYELLENEISEGRQLYESRVDKSLYYSGIYEQALEAFIQNKTGGISEDSSEDEKPTEVFERVTNPQPELELEPESTPDAVSESAATESFDHKIEDDPILEENPESLEKAKEIAKRIISDIMSTHREKAEEGLKNGMLIEVLSDELMLGRQEFEEKAPAYFDTSLFEEIINDYITSKTEGQNQVQDAGIEKVGPEPIKEALESEMPQNISTEMEKQEIVQEPEPVPEDEAWQSPETIENEAPQDIFQEMESQAQEIAQEPEPVPEDEAWQSLETCEAEAPQQAESALEDSAWQSPETIENETSQDIFQEMESQAQEIAQEPKPVPEDEAWQSPETIENEAPQDIFQEMESQAQEIAQEPKPVPEDEAWQSPETCEVEAPQQTESALEDSAWQSPETIENETPQDIFQEMESQAQEIVQKPEPVLEAAQEPSAEEESPELKNAKRLSKIIVSDIVIYNEDKVEKGLKNGTFYEILEDEIKEGRILFESRVSKVLFESGLYENALQDFINSRNGADQEETSDSQKSTEVFLKVENSETPSIQTPEAQPKSENGTMEESKEEKDAKRLAKIIVSDIIIYNEKKVEKGLQNGTFYEILEDDIREGTALYESRVSAQILEEKDYLKEAFADFISKRMASLS